MTPQLPGLWHGDEGGPYWTEVQALARQHALTRYGIYTGIRLRNGMWELLHDPRGTMSDLRKEWRGV